ncbi:hypothetical protein H9P43_003556 [Blastocladiella emersonii ATCC 22665]|nr:hypothetical protein H9P43_003556 [Blastocladiella emersonii ATCC 22665]
MHLDMAQRGTTLAALERLVAAAQPLVAGDFPLARLEAPKPTPLPVSLARLAAVFSPDDLAAIQHAGLVTGKPLTASISLCGRIVATVEFIFDADLGLDFPPEILVVCPGDSNFHCSLADLAPVLDQWTAATAPEVLVALVKRIRDLLRAHHHDLVLRFPNDKLAYDLSTCATLGDLDVGIFPGGSGSGGTGASTPAMGGGVSGLETTSIVLALPIAVEHEDGPDAVADRSVTLQVLVDHTFTSTPGGLEFVLTDVNVSHWLPAAWVSRQDAFKFPTYAREGALYDYLLDVTAAVREGIGSTFSGFSQRRQFIARLAATLAENVVELDTTNYASATFVLDAPRASPSTLVLVTVHLPDRFPADPPSLTLRAPLYMASPASPDLQPSASSADLALLGPLGMIPEWTVKWKSWAFSSRWSLDDLLARTRGWLLDEADLFVGRLQAT